jgi:hypothetical protein
MDKENINPVTGARYSTQRQALTRQREPLADITTVSAKSGFSGRIMR